MKMNKSTSVCGFLILFALLVLLSVAGAFGTEPSGGFVLRDHLGYGWSNECVSFPMTVEQRGLVKKGFALLGPEGQEVVYQVVGGEGESRICFQADLGAYETRTYRFNGGRMASSGKSDLKVVEDGDGIQVVNGRIGIEVRKKLKAGQGPIAAIRVGGSAWTGGSVLEGGVAIKEYKASVVARGQVFVEVESRAVFADGGVWTVRYRVERAEPVVVVDEQFDAPGGGVMRVVLGGNGFQPTHLYHRDARAESAGVLTDPIAGYHLTPWLRWNNNRNGRWIGLYTPTQAGAGVAGGAKPAGASAEMLVMGMIKPSLWVDPKWAGKAPQAGAGVNAAVRDGVMTVDLPVSGGRRVWLLGVLEKSASEALLGKRVAPPAQKLLIKHGDLPLEKVKDYVLEWAGDEDNHPRLYVRKQELAEIKGRLKSDPKELERWATQQPVDKYMLDGPIREFIATGDARLGKRMADKAEEYLQTVVDWYVKEDYLQGQGTAPHMQSLITTVFNLLDPILSTEAFTPEARKRVLARLAFIGYVTGSMDYWSPERGYSGFANMTSIVALYRTTVACMLPNHPEAKRWAELGLGQLRWQLTAWSDEDGGWVEAPHYAMVSFDHMLAGFAMAANSGYGDYAFEPRMRKVAEWFGAISTPRDSRTGGWRHQPPIGNTYHGEPTGVYGLIAAIWKQKDPEFASAMQWVFEQNGSFGGLGIGWNFPSMLGYRFMMSQSGVVAKPVELGSRWFRNTGLVLRNTMQSDRETYLHMIAGGNRSHYDLDSGSIVVYGKGRILCDDWGYVGRHPDRWHSMLTSQDAWGGSDMYVKTFTTSPGLDYVSGQKGAWRREIAFSKDADPLGPNYFVIRDTHDSDAAATWRLWLTGNAVTVHENGATLEGQEDVDLEILVKDAAKLKFGTEKASQNVSCSYREGREGPGTITQIALTGTLAGRGTVCAVLYPRLKSEPAPKVTWSADGKIVEVETAAGKDCVFMAPEVKQATGLKGLTALPAGEPILDCPSHSPNGTATPWLMINAKEQVTKSESPVTFVPGIYVHPDEVEPVTVVWKSPVRGLVSVSATVRRQPADKQDAPADKNDGVIAELRCGAKTLARAVVAPGAGNVTLSANTVQVAEGDLVRLVILPGACLWFDSTQVDMQVRGLGNRVWGLTETLLNGGSLANDLPAGVSEAVWWICGGDGEKMDLRLVGQVLEPLSDVETDDGALVCKAEGSGLPCLWIKRGKNVPIVPDYLPQDSLLVHPENRPMALVWRSPLSGTVRVSVDLSDAEVCTDKSLSHLSDGVRYELRKGSELLASGEFDDGGKLNRIVEGVNVGKGDLLRLLIFKRGSFGWDPTRVEMVVEGNGRRWDAHRDLLRGEKMGNQVGADLAQVVWWACAGDAPAFEPSQLKPAPLPEYTAFGGKVKLQGTIGSVQTRGSKVTMSLAARGVIRMGNKELAADSARTEIVK